MPEVHMLGPISALASSATWAIGSAQYSRLSHSYSAFAVNFARGLLAFPLFFIFSFVLAGGVTEGLTQFAEVSRVRFAWFALSMIASYGLGDVLFLWSTRAIGVPTALAIASGYPLWTAAAGTVFRGESLSILPLLGLFITVAGVVLVIMNSPRNEEHRSISNLRKGVILALLTSVCWATNSFSSAEGGQGLSAPVANSIRMIFAMIFSAGFGWLFLPKASLLLPRKEMVSNLWVFVLEAFGGSYFYMYGLTHSPLAVGATLASLAPVLSVPVAWAMGLEKFSFPRTFSICLVALGVSLLVGAAG